METLTNFSLKPYNTFGLVVFAHSFCRVKTKEDVQLLLVNGLLKEQAFLILGGGSNILFTKNFEGLVIKNEITGISIVQETDNEVWITAQSGTIWHDLVLFCVQNNYQGIENLALIPGTVGAAPIQNIGAYG
ncbi:MAG: FAD-binding protein, partial [Bacteroidetes bacterium]|nr:FAD-binding protein [Bacteroidota bacterium]